MHTRIGRAGISQYQADMPERILQSPQESAPEAPTGKVTVSDIELVSREGKSFPCCKALLEKMCLYFNGKFTLLISIRSFRSGRQRCFLPAGFNRKSSDVSMFIC